MACLRQWFCEQGIHAQWRSTCRPGDGTRLALEARRMGSRLVVAYGGDGTINEVACGLVGGDVPLGILPGGTANVLAEELGIPLLLNKAVKVLRDGFPRRICVGKAGDRLFLLMAGIGLDAAVVQTIPPAWKDSLGEMGFFLHALRRWIQKPLPRFTVSVDGECFEDIALAVIANARNYGGGLKITPTADIFEENLRVSLFPAKSKFRYLAYYLAAISGRMERLAEIIQKKATHLEGLGPGDTPVQVDGEFIGKLPMRFEVIPGGLSILMPANTAGLRNVSATRVSREPIG